MEEEEGMESIGSALLRRRKRKRRRGRSRNWTTMGFAEFDDFLIIILSFGVFDFLLGVWELERRAIIFLSCFLANVMPALLKNGGGPASSSLIWEPK